MTSSQPPQQPGYGQQPAGSPYGQPQQPGYGQPQQQYAPPPPPPVQPGQPGQPGQGPTPGHPSGGF